jgi:hypothetical protein
MSVLLEVSFSSYDNTHKFPGKASIVCAQGRKKTVYVGAEKKSLVLCYEFLHV